MKLDKNMSFKLLKALRAEEKSREQTECLSPKLSKPSNSSRIFSITHQHSMFLLNKRGIFPQSQIIIST